MGVILAGGQGRRMGGVDKALLPLCGQPLVAHVAARLAPQCAGLWLSANGDPARFAPLRLEVLPDAAAEGPLAGVLAGLERAAQAGQAAIVTAPVDTPFLPQDLVARLRAAAGQGGLALAASPDPAGVLRRHPTCGVWPVRLRAALRAALAAGERRVGAFAAAQGAQVAAFVPARGAVDPFFNVNTPADLAAAEAWAARPVPGG